MSVHLDFDRDDRLGFPEVVYGEGKSEAQLVEISLAFVNKKQPLLITRLGSTMAGKVHEHLAKEGGEYILEAKSYVWKPKGVSFKKRKGLVNLICAGSSDIGVICEAETSLNFFGVSTQRICDVGVAGIHRLLGQTEKLECADIHIVAAGMDGALPSVVGGLVRGPIIAVPTSVGYGAAFGGVSALLAMLNSCAGGVSVVNIDNGFGAAMAAVRILALKT